MATIQASDVLPVRSRVSWPAILAGAVIALTVYFVLTLFGVALGLSVSGHMDENRLGWAAGVWALVSMLLALFVGGYVGTRCTVGENKTEAALTGIVVWGVVFSALSFLTAGAINTGLNAIMGIRSPARADTVRLTDDELRSLGFTDEQLAQMRTPLDRLRTRMGTVPEEVKNLSHDPRTTAAAWWALTGIIVSLASAVAGALVGSGPNLVITALRVRAAAVAEGTGVTPPAAPLH